MTHERHETRLVESEITRLRHHLDQLLTELDRRRRELTDVRLQARRHALPLALAGTATATLVAGGVVLSRHRRRRRELRAVRRGLPVTAERIETEVAAAHEERPREPGAVAVAPDVREPQAVVVVTGRREPEAIAVAAGERPEDVLTCEPAGRRRRRRCLGVLGLAAAGASLMLTRRGAARRRA